jgi:hypothetical protein
LACFPMISTKGQPPAATLLSKLHSPAMDIMDSIDPTPERIVCAAVRASNGKIVIGDSHYDAIRALQAMEGYEREKPKGENQGFITSCNRFVTRREAYCIHFPERVEAEELTSEDLE